MKKMAKPEKKQIPDAGAGLDAIIDKYKEKSEPSSSREEAFKSFITSTSRELYYGRSRIKPKFSFPAFGRPSGVVRIPKASLETRRKINVMRLIRF